MVLNLGTTTFSSGHFVHLKMESGQIIRFPLLDTVRLAKCQNDPLPKKVLHDDYDDNDNVFFTEIFVIIVIRVICAAIPAEKRRKKSTCHL